ncbi:MAG: hypothetical protein EBS48_05820 [Actinobacteria bacterium]|nr:hypothetical protein [Actinomycetota bacterium]
MVLPAGVRTAGVETAADLLARAGAHTALPVPAPLAPVLPMRGLERGRVHGVTGDAAASLVYALVAAASAEGAWCAFVDMPHAGLRAAHEHGVALERVVCIDTDRSLSWGRVVGALTDGIDIIVARDPVCTAAEARKVASRVKAQGAVLIVQGAVRGFPLDVLFTARTQSWSFGACALERTVRVTAEGRRIPAARGVTVLLPSASGAVAGV